MGMKVVGAILGAVIGIFVGLGAGDGAIVVAGLGAVIGWFVGRWIEQPGAPGTARGAEPDLRDELALLKRRVDRLERELAASGSHVIGPHVAPSVPLPEAAPAAAPAPEAAMRERVASANEIVGAASAPRAPEAPMPHEVAMPSLATPVENVAGDLFTKAWNWLLGGNTVVRVGVVILFFGVAFLLKYAYEHTRIPIEFRLLTVAIGAIALLVLGWRLRGKQPGYALALQGGGVGVLYLTIFAAFRLYGLLPPLAALVLLAGVATFSAALAVLQESRSLAVLGASGGFLAPILASTGAGSHVMLFSYYALLNAGILGVAWHRSWRSLNVLGFVFTFVIGALWGSRYYRPEFFATTEPFLVLFFLFYVAIPILFARREAPQLTRYLDGTLVFGVPIVAFGLQLALVRGYEYGAAWSATALGGFYIPLAWLVFRATGQRLRMLVEAFLALGVGFATLAIPLAFEGRWTAAVWAVEGAALVWVGVRQDRRLARGFGTLLQFAAGVAFSLDFDRGGGIAVLNSRYLGYLLIAFAGLYSSWSLGRRGQLDRRAELLAAAALFVWGVAWWTAGGIREIDRFVAERYELAAQIVFLSLSCAGFALLARRFAWGLARYAALATTPIMAASAGLAAMTTPHPLAQLGFVAWPLAFAAHLFVLRREEARFPRWAAIAHPVGLWLLAALGAWELGWWTDRLVAGDSVWRLIAWAIVPAVLLAGLSLRGERVAWPVAAHVRAYLVSGAAPIAVFLVGWTLFANLTSDGNPAPLPYLPLLNPLDLAQAGALLVVATWLAEAGRRGLLVLTRDERGVAYATLGAAAFVWANGILLRTLHHWAGVPFAFDAMMRSVLVQASFSIFWTVIALGGMVFATRGALRTLWLAGAALMAVVVVKLFLVDLSHVGGVERIVSFIVVGILMLVIGYFSPVPPKAREESR